MKNFSKVQLPWVEKEYETSEKAEKQVQMEDALSDLMQDGGGGSTVTPPPPPTHTHRPRRRRHLRCRLPHDDPCHHD